MPDRSDTAQWPGDRLSVLILAALCIAVWLGLQVPALQQLGAAMAHDALIKENTEYLRAAEKQAAKNFVHLAESYAALRVIQSGRFGVSFLAKADVQVGDALAGLSDIVERTMDVSAAAAVAAATLNVTDRIAARLSPLLFEVALLAIAIYLIALAIDRNHRVTHLTKGLAEIGLLLFLTAYILIPYSIHTTGWLSEHAVAGLKADSSDQIAGFRGDVTRATRGHDLVKRAEQAAHDLKKQFRGLTHKVSAMGRSMVRQATAALIEGVLLPLGVFAMLWLALRRLMRQASTVFREPSAQA